MTGHAPGTLHDYAAEFHGIQSLRTAGLGDVELHGYTHMHPDSASWAKRRIAMRQRPGIANSAKLPKRPSRRDRQTSIPWPSVLQPCGNISGATHNADLSRRPMDRRVLERALDLGLQLMSSYYLAIRDESGFAGPSTSVLPTLISRTRPGSTPACQSWAISTILTWRVRAWTG